MIPVIVGTGSSTLVLKSDSATKTVIPVNKPRGTVFWGGAGLDGPYLKPMVQAFIDAGIHYIWSGLSNTATKIMPGTIGTLIDAARTGMMIKMMMVLTTGVFIHPLQLKPLNSLI
ncbi:hypothetical protein ACDX34_02645 [Acinetobacter bereziniae]|uniref:hypothetical protein n=1 Tax=Acinetobacter bereziniae TaxID=106648 RepID=UPI0039C24ADA